MKKFLSFFLLTVIAAQSHAQPPKSIFFPNLNYDKAGFINPVKIPMTLAGNFGECRTNHFHSGLDVRTNNQENINIHAIGSGYVSKISISHKGFGNCIFVSHPGGYTSVYAHCNRFDKILSAYIEQKQYEQEKWDIELKLPPHLFPVRKGQFIAKSGNTGSSRAPHLHMEIRNTLTDKTLNGLLFYPKLQDTKKPIISRMAIYDANQSIYSQTPQIFSAIKKGVYDVPGTELISVNSDKVYFGIQANDYMENSLRLGIFRMKLIVDGQVQFGWQLNNISYDETRYMNAIGDYKTKMNKGFWLQLCHRLPNDKLDVYITGTKSNGIVDLSDGKRHKVIIRVYDVKGNLKDIRFDIQGKKGLTKKAEPIASCRFMLQAGKKNHFSADNISFDFKPNQLYDNLCIKTSNLPSDKPYSYLYQVHFDEVPVHDYFDLMLKPKAVIPKHLEDKVAVLYAPEAKMQHPEGIAAGMRNQYVVASVRKFGFYEIVIDQQSPTVIPYFGNGQQLRTGSQLRFGAEDNVTELREVRMEVDGKWLCCKRRYNAYTYTVDDHFPKGKHTVTIKAVDGNRNETIKSINVVRL